MAIGFWMNNKNCYGCKTCSIACKSEKQLDRRRVAAACDGNSPGCSEPFAYLSMLTIAKSLPVWRTAR